MSEETKRLGIFLSFKKSEEKLLNDIKSIKNYSAIIKELMQLYIDNGNKMPNFDNSNTLTPSNTLTVTFDDICKLVSCVNPIAPVKAEEVVEELSETTNTDKPESSKDKQSQSMDEDDMNAFS